MQRASTVFDDAEGKQTVVAGVDPGRVNMAVIAIVTKDESGKIVKKTWALGGLNIVQTPASRSRMCSRRLE